MTSPENISIGVEELLGQAKRLGLTPVYRQGTVLGTTTPGVSQVMVTLDNDTQPSRCYNYAGQLATGDRVLVMAVRPQGLYVLGTSTVALTANTAVTGINLASAIDTTTSATYVNITGTSSVLYSKNVAATKLEVDLRITCFSTAVNTQASFAVLIGGTDFEITNGVINPANTHRTLTGKGYLAGVAAGLQTVQIRWRRVAGAGTLTRAVDDWVSLSVREVV